MPDIPGRMTELGLFSPRPLGHWGRSLFVTAIVVTLGLANSAPATAARPTVKAFQQWGDTRDYKLLTGGDFESWSPSTLMFGAYRVPENEPWKVFDATDRTSVELPSGSTVAVRSTESYFDDIRLFVKKPGRWGSKLIVRIEAIGWGAGVRNYVIDGSVAGWSPSDPLVMPVPRGPQLLGLVVVTISTVGPGTWRIDDLAIDPWRND